MNFYERNYYSQSLITQYYKLYKYMLKFYEIIYHFHYLIIIIRMLTQKNTISNEEIAHKISVNEIESK